MEHDVWILGFQQGDFGQITEVKFNNYKMKEFVNKLNSYWHSHHGQMGLMREITTVVM